MLWLAGLLGLMAAGTVGVLQMGDTDADATEASTETDNDDGGAVTTVTSLSDLLSDPAGTPGDGDEVIEPPVDVAGLTIGTDADETLTGESGSDTIMGSGGNDVIDGMGGDDSLQGGDGDDLIEAGAGADEVFGNNDDDTITGGAGSDSLNGSAGADVVDGGADDDVIWGGLDDDTLSGGTGADTVFGGFGDDLISGVDTDGAADVDAGDYLNGGDGDDTIIAGNDDVVTAGSGADDIVVGDWIMQGSATDVIDFNADEDDIILVYDDAGGAPDLNLSPDPDSPDVMHVVMDGVTVAHVSGGAGLELGDVTVMPLSAAQDAGFAPL
ncbi:MAG: calcium-binding protein [Pseudomonadota bacterium]